LNDDSFIVSQTLSESATPILVRELCGAALADANVRCQAAWLLEGLELGFIVGGADRIDRGWLERLAASLPAEPPRGRRIDWAALQVWIDAHLADALDVAALARRVHLSANQFAARCKQELKLAPMALVRQQRLAAALRLRHAGLPVAQVAAQCGYRSPSALTAALKREASAP